MKPVRRIFIILSGVGVFIATMLSVDNHFLKAENRFKTITGARAMDPTDRSTNCADTLTPGPGEWPPSQQDVWKPVIANSDVIFVFSAFLTPRHTVAILAMMRDFETRPKFFCQFWCEAAVGKLHMTVKNARLELSGESQGLR